MHTDTHAIKKREKSSLWHILYSSHSNQRSLSFSFLFLSLPLFAGYVHIHIPDHQSSAWWSVGCWESWIMEFGLMIRPKYKSDGEPWNRWAILVFQSVPSARLPHITAVVPLAWSWKEQPAAPALKNKSSALHLARQQPHHDWLCSAYLCQPCTFLCFSTLGVPISLPPPIYISTRWVAFEWPSLALIAPINLSRFTLA